MEDEGYIFKFTKPAKEFLAVEGYDQAYGARPIRRAIQRYVEDLVADAIIDERIKPGVVYTINKLKTEDKLTLK
jgi:ATP-dependent Clp protease ATP-binding subunit ClpC